MRGREWSSCAGPARTGVNTNTDCYSDYNADRYTTTNYHAFANVNSNSADTDTVTDEYAAANQYTIADKYTATNQYTIAPDEYAAANQHAATDEYAVANKYTCAGHQRLARGILR